MFTTYAPNLHNFYPELNTYANIYYDVMIVSIFLVAGVCVGLLASIWAFPCFFTLFKYGGRFSAFIIFLIINDLVELLLSAIIASYLINYLITSSAKSLKEFTEYGITIYEFTNVMKPLVQSLIAFRLGGLYLHQLVALQGILSLRNKSDSANICSLPCSIISSIILWLLAFVCQYLNVWLTMIFSILPCCILACTIVLTRKASPSRGHVKYGSVVLIISTLTLICFYATAAAVITFRFVTAFNFSYEDGFDLSKVLISLRVISDPVLCVLVIKDQLIIHKKRINTEMNTDQRSV